MEIAIGDLNVFGPIGVALPFLIAAAPARFFGLPFFAVQFATIKLVGPHKCPVLF